MKNRLILLAIFIISFSIRFYNSDRYPSLLWDEAANGYNAYSITQNLKDEHGKFLPLIFKSFGDFKPGFYIYLIIPFIKILGLNELSTRLPSIILGSLLPIFIYLLIRQIDNKKKNLAILSALVLAFNPYNIHYSKMAWETNILTVELVLASYFFFKFINTQKNKFLLFSSLIFGLTLYTYQAGKMISLFLIITLIMVNIKNINFKKFSQYFYFILPLLFFSLSILYGMLFSQDANRLKVLSIFSYKQSQVQTNQLINETNKYDYLFFHNDLIYFQKNILLRYFNHFSPNFLTFIGDWQSSRHSAIYYGVLLLPSIVFLYIGIFSSFFQNNKSKINLFFLLWLIFSPIPASLTRDSVQATRSMSFSIPLVYFISYGLLFMFEQIKYKKTYILSIVFVYSISFILYADLYLNHTVNKNPGEYLYGYKQAMTYVINNQEKFDKVYFSDFYGQPYIYYLFYSKFSPIKYQSLNAYKQTGLDTGKVDNINNIYFESTNWQKVNNEPNTLAIFSHDEILRQNLDFSKFIPLSKVNGISTFYAYQN